MTDIVILGGARTAIGSFGGSLAGVAPVDLGTVVAKAALERSGVAPGQIGTVVFGHVINTEPRDMYLSRVAAMQAGVPDRVPAMNVNRLCGSGVQAIVSATQALALGEAEFALAGGAECMSRSPHILPTARFGQKMGDTKAIDMMTGALTCPFGTGHMGITAENVAAEQAVSREDQDAFALESQARAARAIAEGRFAGQIVPVELTTRKGVVHFDRDEHPKATSLEALAGLKPAFRKDGTITAGSASQISDGAAAVVVMSRAKAEELGLTWLAEIGAHGVVAGPDASLQEQPANAILAACAKEDAGRTTGTLSISSSPTRCFPDGSGAGYHCHRNRAQLRQPMCPRSAQVQV